MSRAARLGAFIIVALTILVSGIFIIGGKQYLFTSTYRLNDTVQQRRGAGFGSGSAGRRRAQRVRSQRGLAK